jgi:streptomycin 6-kinase
VKKAPILIPRGFARDTITREGKAGRAWLAALPGMVEELCQYWQLEIEGSVMNGYTGLAIPVQREGEGCILKVYWRDEDTDSAALALNIWNGRGAVKLLAHKLSSGAMLLERLDPESSLAKVEISEAIVIAGRLLRRLAILAPAQMRSVTTLAARMAQSMPQRWKQYGCPFSRQLLDQVCEWTAQLGPASDRLMTNYDLHYTDVLAGHREPWLMIDPKAIAGDPEFSLAQLLWTRLEDIEAQRGLDYHFRALVEAAELDYELARTWTIIRCADYWLWGLTVGLTNDPARCDIIIQRLNRQ